MKTSTAIEGSPSIKVAKPVVIHRAGDILNKNSSTSKILETQVKKTTGKISLINIKQNIERLRDLYKKNFMTQNTIQTNLKQPIQTFPCQFCEKKFTTEDFLMFHIKKFHSSQKVKVDSKHLVSIARRHFLLNRN